MKLRIEDIVYQSAQDFLTAMRTLLGVSQAEFARRMRISRSALQRMEGNFELFSGRWEALREALALPGEGPPPLAVVRFMSSPLARKDLSKRRYDQHGRAAADWVLRAWILGGRQGLNNFPSSAQSGLRAKHVVFAPVLAKAKTKPPKRSEAKAKQPSARSSAKRGYGAATTLATTTRKLAWRPALERKAAEGKLGPYPREIPREKDEARRALARDTQAFQAEGGQVRGFEPGVSGVVLRGFNNQKLSENQAI